METLREKYYGAQDRYFETQPRVVPKRGDFVAQRTVFLPANQLTEIRLKEGEMVCGLKIANGAAFPDHLTLVLDKNIVDTVYGPTVPALQRLFAMPDAAEIPLAALRHLPCAAFSLSSSSAISITYNVYCEASEGPYEYPILQTQFVAAGSATCHVNHIVHFVLATTSNLHFRLDDEHDLRLEKSEFQVGDISLFRVGLNFSRIDKVEPPNRDIYFVTTQPIRIAGGRHGLLFSK